MRRKERIVRASAREIAERMRRGEGKSDWKRAKAMPQAAVERLADREEGALPAGWESTVIIGLPPPKQDIHIRIDADVLAWFRRTGKGYQTRINNVLRAFVASRKGTAPRAE